MMCKRFLCAAAAFGTLALWLPVSALACTIFTKQSGDTVLLGNNEDFMYSYSTHMTVTAPSEGEYGRVCFSISGLVQGGMNEYGLCYDGATCPAHDTPFFDGLEQLGMDLGEVVLTKCKTVEEAADFLAAINIPNRFCDHLLFADASGAGSVFEWVNNGLTVVEKERGFQLITNFWLSDPALGGYPCARYDTAAPLLESGEATAGGFAQILEATRQDWGNGGTLYSNVYDLTRQTVTIYRLGDFTHAYTLTLADALSGMEAGGESRTDLSALAYGDAAAPTAAAAVGTVTSSDGGTPEAPADTHSAAPFLALAAACAAGLLLLLLARRKLRRY